MRRRDVCIGVLLSLVTDLDFVVTLVTQWLLETLLIKELDLVLGEMHVRHADLAGDSQLIL